MVAQGGTEINAGHPMIYIQVNNKFQEPAVCKYCGLRYQLAEEDEHDHHEEHKHEGPQRGEN